MDAQWERRSEVLPAIAAGEECSVIVTIERPDGSRYAAQAQYLNGMQIESWSGPALEYINCKVENVSDDEDQDEDEHDVIVTGFLDYQPEHEERCYSVITDGNVIAWAFFPKPFAD